MRKFNDSSNVCGKIIKESRLSKDMSQEELSNRLQLMGISVDRSFIYRVEKQISILKDFELLAICEVLDIDFNSLRSLLNNQK